MITGSAFFKALLDNEIYMGIKEDEIIINDLYDLPIDREYVRETLCWLYDENIDMMAHYKTLIYGHNVRNLFELSRYYVLFDFFQIDNLINNCIMEISGILTTNAFNVAIPAKIKKSRKLKDPYDLIFSHGRNIYDFGTATDHIIWCNYKTNLRDFLKAIYSGFSYIKKYAPKYFDMCIDKYISDKSNDVELIKCGVYKSDPVEIIEHIIDSITKNSVLQFKLDRKISKLYFVNNSEYYIEFTCFAEYIMKLHNYMYREKFDRMLYWIIEDENKILPLEVIDYLMNIFPNNGNLVRLLDTRDWQCDGSPNWELISEFEQVCKNHNRIDFFKKKLDAYMNMYHYIG